MIVSCPSCRTRYLHREAVPGHDRQAQCSRCDHRFPLVAAPRSYVLLRETPGVMSPPGMDDPRLATALAGGTTEADPFELVHPEMADEAAAFEEAVPLPDEEPIPRPEEASTPRTAAPRRRLRELLVVMLLASIGTAAGHYGLPYTRFDGIPAIPSGAVAGLLLAWFWLRWTARQR